jgi:N-acetylmuramoyl-L-alanine amidase
VTNPHDATLLADPHFRDVVAEAIVVAVQRVYLPSHEDAQTGVLRLRDLADA